MRRDGWVCLLVAAVCAACSGKDGATGATGATGPAGAAGAAGAKGDPGAPGGTVILSSLAKQGLAISPVPVNTATTNASLIERIGYGSYLVNAVASCNDCHLMAQQSGPPLFLGGGQQFVAGTSTVYARNLTPDKQTGLQLTEEQFITALRTGKDFGPHGGSPGGSLVIMPWPVYRWMTRDDLRAIYAYLRAIPPLTNAVMMDQKVMTSTLADPGVTGVYNEGAETRPLLADSGANAVPDPDNVLRGVAIQPLHDVTATLTPDQLALFGRGSYLVNAIAACNDCHTNPARNFRSPNLAINTAGYLAGGRTFSVPPPIRPLFRYTRSMSANLIGSAAGTVGFAAKPFQIFLRTILEGVHADDPMPKPLSWPMPWTAFRNMTVHDLEAVYTYIHVLQQSRQVAGKVTQDPVAYCAQNGDCATGQTCNTATSECVGQSCTINTDCPACQTCGANQQLTTCAAPQASSSCVLHGI